MPYNSAKSNSESPDTDTPRTEIEREWARKAKEGDKAAFRKIVNRFKKPLNFYISKMISDQKIVEDLVQETFMKAFDSIESYREDYAFSTWLYRIAKNHTIDYLRKKKLNTLSIDEPQQTKEGEIKMELPGRGDSTDREVIRKQRKKMIHQAIDNLPEKYRKVIRLRHMEEKSYQEISDMLEVPLGTVKAHIFRGRELLYKTLKEKRGEF